MATAKSDVKTLCRALNKLIWKIHVPVYDLDHETETPKTLAKYLIAELADADIKGIEWDNTEEMFVPTNKCATFERV